MNKTLKIILGTAVGIVLATGCTVTTEPLDAEPNDRAGVQESKKAEKPKPSSTFKTQADEFRACIQKTGMAPERAAGTHITKVIGADDKNDILDTAEIWTNYTGGMLGDDAGKGKILAAAFAGCYKSKNGMVTVYDANGELLATGQY